MVVTKVGARMKVGEIVKDNGGIEIPIGKMGRRIVIYLPTSIKSLRIMREVDRRI